MNEAFLHIVDDIKELLYNDLAPFSRQTQIRVEKWIEVISSQLVGHLWIKNRNNYALALKRCLLMREFTAPFDKLPPGDGILPNLPPEMELPLRFRATHAVAKKSLCKPGLSMRHQASKALAKPIGGGTDKATQVSQQPLDSQHTGRNSKPIDSLPPARTKLSFSVDCITPYDDQSPIEESIQDKHNRFHLPSTTIARSQTNQNFACPRTCSCLCSHTRSCPCICPGCRSQLSEPSSDQATVRNLLVRNVVEPPYLRTKILPSEPKTEPIGQRQHVPPPSQTIARSAIPTGAPGQRHDRTANLSLSSINPSQAPCTPVSVKQRAGQSVQWEPVSYGKELERYGLLGQTLERVENLIDERMSNLFRSSGRDQHDTTTQDTTSARGVLSRRNSAFTNAVGPPISQPVFIDSLDMQPGPILHSIPSPGPKQREIPSMLDDSEQFQLSDAVCAHQPPNYQPNYHSVLQPVRTAPSPPVPLPALPLFQVQHANADRINEMYTTEPPAPNVLQTTNASSQVRPHDEDNAVNARVDTASSATSNTKLARLQQLCQSLEQASLVLFELQQETKSLRKLEDTTSANRPSEHPFQQQHPPMDVRQNDSISSVHRAIIPIRTLPTSKNATATDSILAASYPIHPTLPRLPALSLAPRRGSVTAAASDPEKDKRPQSAVAAVDHASPCGIGPSSSPTSPYGTEQEGSSAGDLAASETPTSTSRRKLRKAKSPSHVFSPIRQRARAVWADTSDSEASQPPVREKAPQGGMETSHEEEILRNAVDKLDSLEKRAHAQSPYPIVQTLSSLHSIRRALPVLFSHGP